MSALGDLFSSLFEGRVKKGAKNALMNISKETAEDASAKSAKKLVIDDALDIATPVKVVTSKMSNGDRLDDLYKKIISYKNNGTVKKALGSLSDTGPLDYTVKTKYTPYRNELLSNYDKTLKNILGDNYDDTVRLLRDYTAKTGDRASFDSAKNRMKDFLNSPKSDRIVEASKYSRSFDPFVKNQPAYRAMNSKDGLSYTTDLNVAIANADDGAKIAKIGGSSEMPSRNGRYIAPAFTERFHTPATSEIIGDVRGYQQILDDAAIQKELEAAGKYLPTTMYHSTNAAPFNKFDDAMLGSSTGYGNTVFGHFVTSDSDFSRRFGDNMLEVSPNFNNPITHPINAHYKYPEEELDNIVANYFAKTGNIEGLDALKKMAEEDGTSLYDTYMGLLMDNNPYELAKQEKEILAKNGYDAVEFVEGNRANLIDKANPWERRPVSSYAVFDGSNLDIKNAKKYLPVKSDDVAESIPVYTKDDFITDDSIFDDPAFEDILKNHNKESVKANATLNDLEMMKRAKAGEVLTEDEIRNSRFVKKLGIDAKIAKIKYGNKLNITKAMEEGKEKVNPELEKRLRGMADQVLDRLHKDPNIKYEHKAVIFMGGPSSGKSSAGMKLYDAAKGGDYAVIDSDDIKPMFEEFGKGEGAGAVHLASAYTAKNMVLPDAAAEGMNLALPIVGKTDKALNYHLNLLKNAGYDVSVVDVSLPTDKAASRNFSRMLETNRNVEDTYVRDVVDQKPAGVYKRMVENVKAGKDKRVSGYAKISNDVKRDEPQILEEISPSDVLKRVQDKFGKNDKYEKITKKAKNYKNAERFEKMNNPIKGSEIWGDKPTSAFQRDTRAVRVNMFPNEAVKGTGMTKQYLLNMFKDAYDQGITSIVPSYGIYTKEGSSFMDHLVDQGWLVKDGNYGYKIAPKIAEWEKTEPLRDIYNKAHNK